MENYQANQPSAPPLADEVKTFYQRDFKDLFLAFFQDPVNGLQSIFANPPAKGFTQALIIFGSVFVLYLAGTYLVVGDMRDYMRFSQFLSIALTPVLIMLCIAALSFVCKIIRGKADFKNELLTGALCGLPLGLIIVLALVLRIFGEGINPLTFFNSPLSGGWLMTVALLYFFLMMVNVFQQSLRAAGYRDALAWYLSPVSILIAMYVGMTIVGNLF
jgi:hypothetical protein